MARGTAHLMEVFGGKGTHEKGIKVVSDAAAVLDLGDHVPHGVPGGSRRSPGLHLHQMILQQRDVHIATYFATVRAFKIHQMQAPACWLNPISECNTPHRIAGWIALRACHKLAGGVSIILPSLRHESW